MADEETEIPAEPVEAWEWVSVKRPAKRPADPLDPPAWVSARGWTETLAEIPGYAPAAPAAVATVEPMAEPATKTRRLRRIRRVGRLVIVAGAAGVIGMFGYFLVTCAYTHVQQNQLRSELAAENPQAVAAEAALAQGDFIPMGTKVAEADHRAELAAFRAAAAAFAATVVPGGPIGRIVIPKIGVDVVMVEGTDKGFLKEGPGHWSETPFPGQKANFVVSGHRTTYGAPFFKLNEMEVGDEIDLVMPYVVARYTVTRVVIVYPDEVDKVKQLGREQVSLAACHPIYSSKQRIVVQGDLTGFVLIDQQNRQD